MYLFLNLEKNIFIFKFFRYIYIYKSGIFLFVVVYGMVKGRKDSGWIWLVSLKGGKCLIYFFFL